jgi:hypothetical protein
MGMAKAPRRLAPVQELAHTVGVSAENPLSAVRLSPDFRLPGGAFRSRRPPSRLSRYTTRSNLDAVYENVTYCVHLTRIAGRKRLVSRDGMGEASD